MLRKPRFWSGVPLLLALYLLLPTQNASAHAVVIRAEPADGAVVATTPDAVTLWLNEAVVPRFSTVQLLDAQNQVLPGLTIEVDLADHSILHIKSLPTLPLGGYTLFWKVLSDVDGHFSQGFTTLTVGDEAAAARQAPTAINGLPTAGEGILRWLNYLILTSLIGALAMLQWVLPTSQRQSTLESMVAQTHLRRRVLQLAAGSAGAAFLIGWGLLAWQVHVAQVAGSPTATASAQVWWLLSQSKWGILWIVRQSLLLFLGGTLLVFIRLPKEPTTAWPWLLLYGRAIDLAIVQALIGHAGGSNHDWLLVLGNDAVHLLAAGVWIGGLLILFLLFGLRRIGRQPASPGWRPIDWRAFSLSALVSVGLLFVSGLYSMGQQVASVDALLTTIYGQLLIGKIMLVFVVGFCGLGNALLVHPRLTGWLGRQLGRPLGWQPLAPAKLPRLIGFEVGCGLLILGAVGLLTATAPPRTVEYTIAPADIKPVLGQRVDDLIVTLEAKPNQLGRNLFNVRSVSTESLAPNVARVSLDFTYLGDQRKLLIAIAEEVETNFYQASGNYLTQAGAWQIDVTIQRYDMADSIAHFRWVAPPAGELQPVLLSKAPWTDRLTAVALGLLLAMLLVGGGYWLIAKTNRPLRAPDNTFQQSQNRNR